MACLPFTPATRSPFQPAAPHPRPHVDERVVQLRLGEGVLALELAAHHLGGLNVLLLRNGPLRVNKICNATLGHSAWLWLKGGLGRD